MHRTIYQKIIIALICLLSLIIPSFITKISASSELATCNIIIKGKENQKYKAGLAIKIKEETEKEQVEIENAITNYKDEEGYEFIGMYSEFTTIDTLFYEYIFEKNLNFKVLILTESNILLVTKELTCKEFNTTCIINLENMSLADTNKDIANIISDDFIEIENNFQARILKLIFRLAIVFIIIYLITMFFGYHKFKYWYILEIAYGLIFLVTNIITTINIKNLGLDTASDILIGISLGIIVIETVLYIFMIKKEMFKEEPSKVRKIVYLIINSILPLIINVLLLGVLG